MEQLIKLDESCIEQAAELFKKAFALEPWNDDWSDRAQLLEYIKEVSLSYNALGGIRHWWQGANYNIEELCVAPDFQGQGVGSRFLTMIEAEAKSLSLAGIFLQTDSDKPSCRFYKKDGFANLEKRVSLFKLLKVKNS